MTRHCFQGHVGGVLCLQFDKRRLVTGGADHLVRLWDVRSGRSLHVFHGHKVSYINLGFP